jgi:hypothetical protein
MYGIYQVTIVDIKEKIIKECFWDYSMTPQKIDAIVHSDDKRLKQKLFTKIMHNATDKLAAVMIFKDEDIKELLDAADKTNDDIKLLRNILLNETNMIERLRWKKR